MRLQKVTGPAFTAKCADCGRTKITGSQQYILPSWSGYQDPEPMWADLDGKPFEAYYCEACVLALAAGIKKEPPCNSNQ
jgi:hypothetical protein